ncbi:hypothetical protein [Micromonospora okii]|uniref:hypothetical protein n=1 Tax=Micromonospora okii TaxID=1182970 RepID=UPI001E3AF7DA|nr:hypothetical protein [Micromonospora okii]
MTDQTARNLLNTALTLAPQPDTRETATREAWVRHYAALALAAYAEQRAGFRNLPRNPAPGSRPDLGRLGLIATSALTAAAALVDPDDAPALIWDLTPEAGALNGEWEDWLADTLVRHGINPAAVDPDLDPADFAKAVRLFVPDAPYVCPTCGETAYLHRPDCSAAQAAAQPA